MELLKIKRSEEHNNDKRRFNLLFLYSNKIILGKRGILLNVLIFRAIRI